MFSHIQKKKLLKFFENFRFLIEKKVSNFNPQYTAFGIFGVINYPLFYFIWKHYEQSGYESFSLRLTLTTLAAVLLLRDYWPRQLRPWLPVYWYITLLLSLPFFFFFMLFMNHGGSVWLMSSNTILFWLLILVEPASYITILTIGIVLAWLVFLFLNPHFVFNFEKWWGTTAQFIASFVVVAFFTQKKQSMDEKKLQAMQALAGTLAHEIRTPLAGIQANVESILPYWSTLIHAYQTAREKDATVTHIRPAQLRLLETAVDRMRREVELVQNTISMLLMNVTLGRIRSDDHALCSISQCVEQALTRYPFEPNQLAMIQWNKTNDFVFKGNELLTVHVLFNLLKNALYHIKAANRGKIQVWFHTTSEHHQLHFRDTAKGISAKFLPHIFECFVSKTYHGSGIGLTFCKAALESMGGSIACESVEGECAEFILRFPKSV